MERNFVTLDDVERRMVTHHREPFNNWLRQIVTLSSGALTLLVGLQSQYVPQHPKGLILLRASWGLLAVAVLAGIVALRGEWQTWLDATSRLRSLRQTRGDAAAAASLSADDSYRPRQIFLVATQATFWAFAFAVLLLATFAIWNLGSSVPVTSKP
jgi:hypothetical protein